MMYAWEELFTAKILAWGREYWEEDRVQGLTGTKNKFTAAVMGSDAYEVEITLANGAVTAMSCDCPYAEEDNCKHMAAVLYALEESHYQRTEAAKSKADWRTLLAAQDAETLRQLVTALAEDDRALQEKIVLRFSPAVDAGMVKQMKRRLDGIIDRWGGRDGFIEYRDYDQFASDIVHFLDDQETDLLEKNLPAAFELLCYAVKALETVEGDDSDGGLVEILEDCGYWMELIAGKADAVLRRQMRNWFRQYGLQGDAFDDWADEWIFAIFDDEESLLSHLDMLDERILRWQSEDAGDGSNDYWLQRDVLRRADVMEQLEMDAETQEAYLRQFVSWYKVRLRLVRLFLEQRRLSEAIDLLAEGLAAEKFAGVRAQYEQLLLAAYEQMGDPKLYREKLLEYLLRVEQRDLEQYRVLKALYTPQEWPEVSKKIIARQQMTGPVIYTALLAEEGLYGEILLQLQQEPQQELLDRYAAPLAQRFPEEVMALYRARFDQQAKAASSRRQYADLVEALRKVRDYPGGEELLRALCAEWRVTYKSRRAMQEELRAL